MIGRRREAEVRGKWLAIIGPPPSLFSVSVDSKRVKFSVSLLFATLMGTCVSVDSKGVRGLWRSVRKERVTGD
jgi:hypothetical protein